jgi:hypothetical protein
MKLIINGNANHLVLNPIIIAIPPINSVNIKTHPIRYGKGTPIPPSHSLLLLPAVKLNTSS